MIINITLLFLTTHTCAIPWSITLQSIVNKDIYLYVYLYIYIYIYSVLNKENLVVRTFYNSQRSCNEAVQLPRYLAGGSGGAVIPPGGQGYCKVCSHFASAQCEQTPFVNKAGTFGDHPTLRANKHLSSGRHEGAVKKQLAFPGAFYKTHQRLEIVERCQYGTSCHKDNQQSLCHQMFF